ncbi:unnamed protein product [Amoebophrya sp. A120]|nr:unnamed protein product [Amoebophrya sp. A120]|eukprot:GSA120T00007768001.1
MAWLSRPKAPTLFAGWVKIFCLLVTEAECSSPSAGPPKPIVAKLVDSGFTEKQIEALERMQRNAKPLPAVCSDFHGIISLHAQLIAVDKRQEKADETLRLPENVAAARDEEDAREEQKFYLSFNTIDFEVQTDGQSNMQEFLRLYCLFTGLGYDLSGFLPSHVVPPQIELTEEARQIQESLYQDKLYRNFAEENNPGIFSWRLYMHMLSLFRADIRPLITAGVLGYIAALEQARESGGWQPPPGVSDATPLAFQRAWAVTLQYAVRPSYRYWHTDEFGFDRLRYSLPLYGAPTVLKRDGLTSYENGTTQVAFSPNPHETHSFFGGGVLNLNGATEASKEATRVPAAPASRPPRLTYDFIEQKFLGPAQLTAVRKEQDGAATSTGNVNARADSAPPIAVRLPRTRAAHRRRRARSAPARRAARGSRANAEKKLLGLLFRAAPVQDEEEWERNEREVRKPTRNAFTITLSKAFRSDENFEAQQRTPLPSTEVQMKETRVLGGDPLGKETTDELPRPCKHRSPNEEEMRAFTPKGAAAVSRLLLIVDSVRR